MTSYKNNPSPSSKSNNSKVWAGVIILFIGLLLLAGQLNLGHIIPTWVKTWQIILIVIGLAIGGSSSFKNPASFILIGLGTIFLAQKYFYFNVWKLFFPIAIIVVGLWLLTDRKRTRFPHHPRGRQRLDDEPDVDYTHVDDNGEGEYGGQNETGAGYGAGAQHGAGAGYGTGAQHETGAEQKYKHKYRRGTVSDEDFLNSTAIFSEEKKIVTSRNLQGGEVVNIFGGTDINLIQADVQGPIVIDIFQIFAGTKLIVPANWKVHSKVVSIFGEVDDRRFFQESVKDDRKIIYLKGTSIFGGITIKSM